MYALRTYFYSLSHFHWFGILSWPYKIHPYPKASCPLPWLFGRFGLSGLFCLWRKRSRSVSPSLAMFLALVPQTLRPFSVYLRSTCPLPLRSQGLTSSLMRSALLLQKVSALLAQFLFWVL